jgi:hypothetical protein
MKQRTSIGALLIAVSIFAASAATAAAPNAGLGGSPAGMHSSQKAERAHRPGLIQIIRHKAMSMIAVAKSRMGGAGAREAKARAAMAARAKQDPAAMKSQLARARAQ